MNNKKTIIATIIGVALLVLTVVGATFAYFTTATSNDEGVTNVTGKTDAIGSVALTNPTSNLHITLSALDMAQDNLNTYWATNDSTLNYDETEVQRDIAVATLTGGEATTYYECSTTINVSVSGTMVAGLQTGDAYIQFGGLLTDKVDLKNVSSTGYPVTFALNGTDKLTDKVSVSLAIENRNANQNSIAGKELSVTFSNDDLNCTVVEEPEAFAIYSETDNSLRFYKNYDQVQVGDTYNDIVVTSKYTGFENSTVVPWEDKKTFITNVVFEDEIRPISTAYWFEGLGFDEDSWDFVNDIVFDVRNLNTSLVTDMTYMFGTDADVVMPARIIGLETFDVRNVINMSFMFASFPMQESYLLNWDVSNVTNMSQMFTNTTGTLDLSGWDVSNVKYMSQMFAGSNLTSLMSLTNWDVSNVTNMWAMFEWSNISDLNAISDWDVSNVTDMSDMFYYASTGYTSENPLDLSGWDVSKVTRYSNFINDIDPSGSIIPPNFGATS